MALTESDIQVQLSRRRPGQSHLTTKRDEADAVTIMSGTEVLPTATTMSFAGYGRDNPLRGEF